MSLGAISIYKVNLVIMHNSFKYKINLMLNQFNNNSTIITIKVMMIMIMITTSILLIRILLPLLLLLLLDDVPNVSVALSILLILPVLWQVVKIVC